MWWVMLFEWVWKNRNTTDEQMLSIMERMAVAAERQAAAAELSHKAAAENAKSAQLANEASRKRSEADFELIQEERERRKLIDERFAGSST